MSTEIGEGGLPEGSPAPIGSCLGLLLPLSPFSAALVGTPSLRIFFPEPPSDSVTRVQLRC